MVLAGRMGVVRVDMQGVQALQNNPQVQAVYVYLKPIDMDEWAQQQTSRYIILRLANLSTCQHWLPSF